MMRKRRSLQSAIAAGKELLPDEVKTDSPSRLARKLGVNRSERKRISLLQRTSSDKRTSYARIADRVLGSDRVRIERLLDVDTEAELEGSGIGPWMSQRFSVSRGVVSEVDTDEDEQWVGHDGHGRPVWADVLEKQRKRLGWLLADEDSPTFSAPQLPPLEQVLITPGDWPPILPRNEAFTFRQFHVCRQNERAAHAVNEILEHNAGQLNPLVLIGASGCGKTHLLWATGWAFARQEPEKVARILSCATIDDDFTLPDKWSERFVGTSVLLIDDIHLLHDLPDTMHAVGKVVDWALNLGIQVVLTSDAEGLGGGPKNRLSQVLRQAVSVKLDLPSRDSLIMMLRTRSGGRDLLLDDEMLIAIVDRSGRGWGAAKAGLEELAIAVESGESLVDSDDVVRILTGRSPTSDEISAPRPADPEELGEELAREVLDTVFADPLNPAVDIHTVLPEIGTDDYTPPDLMPESSMAAVESVVDRHVGELMDKKKEYVASALTINERDAHLAARPPQLAHEERVKVADDLAPLDIKTNAAFQRLEDDFDRQRENLTDIEGELQSIAMQIDGADSKNLISLVDQLRSVEGKLAEIDPEKLPLPEFVEAKKRRRVFKRLTPPSPKSSETKDGKRKRKAVRRASQQREHEEKDLPSLAGDSDEVATAIPEVTLKPEEVEIQEPENTVGEIGLPETPEPESQVVSSDEEEIPPTSLQNEMAKIASEVMTTSDDIESDVSTESDDSSHSPADIFPESVPLPEVEAKEDSEPVIHTPSSIPTTSQVTESLSGSMTMSTAKELGILTPASIIDVIRPTVTELKPTNILLPEE